MSDLTTFGRALALAGMALTLPLTALAADGENFNPGVRFDLHANVGGYYSLGAGLRVDFVIAPHGILEGVNDEIALSPGLDVFFNHFNRDYYSGGAYMIPSAVLQWNFYLGDHWSIFPEAGVAFYVGDSRYLRRPYPVYAALDVGFGVRYHFSPRNALLARIATPTGLQLGVTF